MSRIRPAAPVRILAPDAATPPFLLTVASGFFRLRDSAAYYVAPAGHAAWVPTSAALESHGAGTAIGFAARFARRLPGEVRVVRPGPLLAVLLQHARRPEDVSPAAAILLVELLAKSPAPALALPEPRSPKALRAATILRENPGERISLQELARYAGASARTLERAFAEETGWTFERWRQQLRLLVAVERLADGASVGAVALEAGYDSTSAFIAMFRRLTGTTPRRFLLAER